MSEITLNEFAQKFADEIGINIETALSENLSDISAYDSMGKIYISILIEELFEFQIEYDHLNSADTLKSLHEICVSGDV